MCIFAFFNSECTIIFSFEEKPLTYKKEQDFINGHYIIFSISFCLVMFHESQNEALWPWKNYKLYTLCAMILFIPPHLTIGTRLILTQNDL
jgi:hypothetical protein